MTSWRLYANQQVGSAVTSRCCRVCSNLGLESCSCQLSQIIRRRVSGASLRGPCLCWGLRYCRSSQQPLVSQNSCNRYGVLNREPNAEQTFTQKRDKYLVTGRSGAVQG